MTAFGISLEGGDLCIEAFAGVIDGDGDHAAATAIEMRPAPAVQGTLLEAMTDFTDMARTIIESNRYMVLGTADEDGVPWVTPVWFAHADHRRFIWVSSPERRHSRNVEARPEVSIVIFDSRVAVGNARAVYMSARAEELSGADLERDVAFFDTAGRAQGLTRRWALRDVQPPAPYRLYRATVSQHWVLDPDSSPDDRAEVML